MTLAWVYTHHREEFIADLRSEYGVELEEEDEESSTTLNRLWVYYNQLPSANRISRAILEVESGMYMWDGRDALIADQIDAINYNTYVFQQANSKQKVKPPKPYPRPDYGKKVREREARKNDPAPKRNRLPGKVTYIPREVNDIPKEV